MKYIQYGDGGIILIGDKIDFLLNNEVITGVVKDIKDKYTLVADVNGKEYEISSDKIIAVISEQVGSQVDLTPDDIYNMIVKELGLEEEVANAVLSEIAELNLIDELNSELSEFVDAWTEDELIKYLNQQIAKRTTYGTRKEIAPRSGYILTWSNSSKRWMIKRGKIEKDTEITLDANQIFAPAPRTIILRIIHRLEELPLYGKSFEYEHRSF